jgi:hypothetical protein
VLARPPPVVRMWDWTLGWEANRRTAEWIIYSFLFCQSGFLKKFGGGEVGDERMWRYYWRVWVGD